LFDDQGGIGSAAAFSEWTEGQQQASPSSLTQFIRQPSSQLSSLPTSTPCPPMDP
jgi:hypothetical protein